MAAEKKTYTVLQTTPKLGREGATVQMTARQAKYWRLAGVLVEGTVAASAATSSKKKGK